MQKLFSILLTFIFLTGLPSCVIPTYMGISSLHETGKIEVDKPISNLLIVGVGSTPSRAFLENLSNELIKLFAQRKMQCEFSYMGKIPRGTHLNVDKIVTSKYDSYLLLNPMDTSYTDLHKQVAIVATPIGGGYGAYGSVIGNRYKEDYYVELYTTDKNELEKIWQGELKVDFDFSQPRIYKKVARSIFDKVVKR